MAACENNVNAFVTILSGLLSADNNVRSRAETEYEAMDGAQKFMLLLNALESNVAPEAGELAAVLLRRLFEGGFENLFRKLTTNDQNRIKDQLIHILQLDMNASVKRKVSDAVSTFAQFFLEGDESYCWPEYLKSLFDFVHSCDPVMREIALLMLASEPNIFGNQKTRYLDVIRQMLLQRLFDGVPEVREAAVKATRAFLLANQDEAEILKQIGPCLGSVIEVINATLSTPEGIADGMLKCVIDLAEGCPQIFRSHLDSTLQLCLKMMSNNEYSESCRSLSLEIVVTLCESAPPMFKKFASKYLPNILNVVLKMMTYFDDDPSWYELDEPDEEEEDSLACTAETALDRIACALGGKAVLPVVLSTLPQMLQSDDWKARHAGLMALSMIGEGCHKQMAQLLPQIVEGILPYLKDPHRRVQYAAINALGQMSSDFETVFQKKFHEKMIPPCLALMSGSDSPRVQAHAGAALVNFFEGCPKSVLDPYMDSIIHTLNNVLNVELKNLQDKGKKLVLEQAVVTISSLADSAEDKFTQYYDNFMPCLKFIIQNAKQDELKRLRGKTIECVSLIGLAVGREKFLKDASEVMDLLLKAHSGDSELAADDPQLSYMIAAWARICKILGKAFQPYLPFVMAPVMKAAGIKPEVALLDEDDTNAADYDEEWQVVMLDEKHNFAIKTAGMEEKATACQMLVCYAKELEEGFIDYVEPTLQLMVGLLKFYFHDGVRIAAAEIMPFLLQSAKVRGSEYVEQMFKFICTPLLQAIDAEPEFEVLCEQMGALAECIEVVNWVPLTNEDMELLMAILDKNLNQHFVRSKDREERRNEEDFDDELEETLDQENEDDYYRMSKICDIINRLFNNYGQKFLVYFDKFLPLFAKLLEPNRSPLDHQYGLSVFADVIQFAGEYRDRYKEYFLIPIATHITNPASEVRQTAAYCIGILGLHGSPTYDGFCADKLPTLLALINKPDSRSEENERATENIISAVTKFLMSGNAMINKQELIPVWLTWLPIWEDDEEVNCVYNFLCDLLHHNNKEVLGENSNNLPRIVRIFAETFHKEGLTPSSDIGKRVIALLRLIQNNGEIFSMCLKTLEPHLQEALRVALESP